MAANVFLKIESPDIKSESLGDKHKDEIDVMSWAWGLSNNSNTHMLHGGGVGKVNVGDIQLTKMLDKASPELMLSICKGTHHGKVTLSCNKAGPNDKPVEYLKITMQEVVLSSLSDAGSYEGVPMENLGLNFAYFKVEYTPQKADGTADAVITQEWNIQTNKSEPFAAE